MPRRSGPWPRTSSGPIIAPSSRSCRRPPRRGRGGGHEPADLAGVPALLARALPEGTAQRDAIAFVEATERLGAELHAEAGWETVAVTLEVPRRHFGPAMALLAELALQPSFPAHEVERLRDERLNDLLQSTAEPPRRVERAFAETIYAPGGPG